MGFNSQAGSVAFRTQSVAGTFPADFSTAAIAMKLKDGALAANRNLIIPDPEVGGGRDVVDAFLGPVTFTGDYNFYARPQGITTLLKAAFGTELLGPAGVQEVETLSITGAPTGGSFTLTYSGQTTAAIPYNATALQVQQALIALSNIGAYEVFCTGGPLPTTPVVITFDGTLTGTVSGAPLTKTDSLTGGSSPATSIVRTTTGLSNTLAAAKSHLFIPADVGALPFLGIEENVGNGFDVFRYTDAVVNTLHFEADASGYLMGTAGMIARIQNAQASPVDVSALYDNLDMIVGTNITVTFNGTSLAARSMKFDFNNNFQADDFRLGSFVIGDLTAKRREVTCGVHIREQDKTLWRQAVYGSSAATSPGGVIAKSPVVITASTYSFLPGSSPNLVYSITVTLPYSAIKPYALKVSGDDVMESDIEFQGLRPNITNPAVMVRVVNDKATVA
jgi:hypothetical protein